MGANKNLQRSSSDLLKSNDVAALVHKRILENASEPFVREYVPRLRALWQNLNQAGVSHILYHIPERVLLTEAFIMSPEIAKQKGQFEWLMERKSQLILYSTPQDLRDGLDQYVLTAKAAGDPVKYTLVIEDLMNFYNAEARAAGQGLKWPLRTPLDDALTLDCITVADQGECTLGEVLPFAETMFMGLNTRHIETKYRVITLNILSEIYWKKERNNSSS